MSIQQHILNEFTFKPTSDQIEAIHQFSDFINDNTSSKIFLLKGYAGTGKTTLIASWLKPLKKTGYKVVLLSLIHI